MNVDSFPIMPETAEVDRQTPDHPMEIHFIQHDQDVKVWVSEVKHGYRKYFSGKLYNESQDDLAPLAVILNHVFKEFDGWRKGG